MGFLPHFKGNLASVSDFHHFIEAFLFYLLALFNYSLKMLALFNYSLVLFNYSQVNLHYLIKP